MMEAMSNEQKQQVIVLQPEDSARVADKLVEEITETARLIRSQIYDTGQLARKKLVDDVTSAIKSEIWETAAAARNAIADVKQEQIANIHRI